MIGWFGDSLVIVTILLLSLILAMLYASSRRLSGLATVSVLAVGCCGVVLVVYPTLLSSLASGLGVGRGTDLLMYFAVICSTFIVPNLYFRLRDSNARMVVVVRSIALLESDLRDFMEASVVVPLDARDCAFEDLSVL